MGQNNTTHQSRLMIKYLEISAGLSERLIINNMMRLPKIEKIHQKYPNLDIQVDGGLNLKTTELASKAGANVIVAGSHIFKSNNIEQTITSLRNIVNSSQI